MITAVRDRWEDTSRNAQLGIGAPLVALVVLVLYRAPGTGSYLAEKAPWGIVVSGMIIGTVTALLAIGLILIYRTNRFINFAYGSMGSFAGVIAIGLHLEQHVNFFLALAIGVAIGIATGGVVDLIVRRFRTSSRLILTVASIGIGQMLAVGELLICTKILHFISLTGGFEIPLDMRFDMGVKTLTGDEILIMMVIPPVLAGLAWFLLRTDVGIAVRAAAENSDRALLLGIPIKRLSTVVWMVAGGLAALTFVLKAPFSGVVPGAASAGPVVLLPALAAAVVARMESLPIAFVAGIALGIMEQVVRWNTSGSPTLQNALFLVVILAALLLQRGKLSRAEESGTSSWSATAVLKPIPEELRRVPEVLWTRRFLLLAVAGAFIWVPNTWGPTNQFLAAIGIVWAMTAVSLVVLTGWGGHISLGQFAIVGVGALVAGNLLTDHNTDMFLVIVASGLAGAVVSLLVGLPALRIKGLFLAVTTLALAVALDRYVINVNNFPSILPRGVERPLLYERIDLNDGYNMYLFCLAFLGLSILAAQGVRKARAGRVIIATRDNERAADAASVPTTRVKLSAFIVAGIIAGVAGALDVLLLTSVESGSFPPYDSINVFATSVIGGLGSVAGAVIGVLLFRYIETLTALGDIRPLLTGGVLLFVLLVLPGGLGQLLYNLRDRALIRVANRRGILVPSLVADKREAKHAENEVGLLQSALGSAPTPTPKTERVEGAVVSRLSASNGSEPILSCQGIDMAYGPVQILFDVDFDVQKGEIVALLGTNGAGKSTLLKGICGLVRPTAGTVRFQGDDITKLSADATTHRGVSLMPGGKGVFPTLTVAENLRLASWLIRKDQDRVEAARTEVETLFPILKSRTGQMAGNLSGGEQQMLALGGALMTQPEVLMIDELSLGLAPTIVGQLLEVVREIHARGTTIVIVEQSVNVALNLAQRAVFMEKGEVRFTGPTSELLERPDILRSVFIAGADLGGDNGSKKTPAKAAKRAKVAADATVVLECAGVVKRFGGITAVNDVDLKLRDGQILGLIGHNGAGKTTLMDCISGFLPIDSGRIRVRGHDVTEWEPHERAHGGVARSFQDALLYPSLTVAETIAVARERHLASTDMVAAAFQLPASYESELAVLEKVDELIDLMGLGAFRQKLTGELSTGSRRIVDLACILAQDPKVLMLDEPSGGVAQKETEALGPLLLRVRDQVGCSVLVIEHDMPLLRVICDEMIALELGGIIAQGTPDEVLEHPAVIESYLGTDDTAINRSGAAG